MRLGCIATDVARLRLQQVWLGSHCNRCGQAVLQQRTNSDIAQREWATGMPHARTRAEKPRMGMSIYTHGRTCLYTSIPMAIRMSVHSTRAVDSAPGRGTARTPVWCGAAQCGASCACLHAMHLAAQADSLSTAVEEDECPEQICACP